MIRTRLFLALALVCSLLTAACSERKADSLERVKKAGEISLAMSGGYPPFNFFNDKNELVGFDVDVAGEVARRLGVRLKPVTTDWSGIIEGLRSGVYDGILGSMAVNPERLKVVDFSEPYYYSGAQLLVRADSPLPTPEALKGKVVGVATGTTFESDARKLGVAETRLYRDDTQTLMELDNGVIDGVITDRVVGVNAVNRERFHVRLLGSPLRAEDIAVAFRKGDDSLREAVNGVLREMRADGTLSALSHKWLKADVTVR